MNNTARDTLLLLIFFLASNCFFAQSSDTEAEELYADYKNKTDSLISVTKINDKTILVSFGADAVTAIKTKDGIVIIDAGISTELTSKYREKIETAFRTKSFAYVINTHGHPDHYGGNSVFPKAKIIAQENALKEISAQLSNPGKKKEELTKIVNEYDSKLKECAENTDEWKYAFTQKMRYHYALNDLKLQIPVKKPEIIFSDSCRIETGDVSFEMISFGKCHSESDILIYIPEFKILFTGDLISKYGKPSINDSLMQDKAKWKRAIAWLENRMPNIEIIISGHGEMLTKDDLKYFNNNILEKSLN